MPPKEITCPICQLSQRRRSLIAGEEASCARCGTTLYRQRRFGAETSLALIVTAMLLWLMAACFPLVEVNKFGLHGRGGLLVVGTGLRREGMLVLGVLADLFVAVLPLLLAGLMAGMATALLMGRRFAGWEYAVRLLVSLRTWAMPEIFLLAVLVAFLKIDELARMEMHAGLAFFMGATVAWLGALQVFPIEEIAESRGSDAGHSSSLPAHRPQSAYALLIAAAIMLVPANLYPIMITQLSGSPKAFTIYRGVVDLFADGLWFVGLVVFVASVVVPLGKIGGLFWLFRVARQKAGSRVAMTVAGVIDFIGRWSMLDIFLLGLLSGLVQFGVIASVRPGPAAPWFAGAVVLTVIAADRFQPRELWQNCPPPIQSR